MDIDKELWQEASKPLRTRRMRRFIGAVMGTVVGVTIGHFSCSITGISIVEAMILTITGSIMPVLGILFWTEDIESGYGDCRLPKDSEVEAGNPMVLRIVLAHLKRKVLRPKEGFVGELNLLLERLMVQLKAYSADALELEESIKQGSDEQMRTIDQSALFRVRQLMTMLKLRIAKLEEQVREAEEIVRPFVERVKLLQAHLDRLTRDERMAESLEAIGQIDLRIPVNAEFLASLRVVAETAMGQLKELTDDTKAVQAAWAEVRLDSTLVVDDEQEIRA